MEARVAVVYQTFFKTDISIRQANVSYILNEDFLCGFEFAAVCAAFSPINYLCVYYPGGCG